MNQSPGRSMRSMSGRKSKKGICRGSSPILVDWDCLTDDFKEMNRTQADDIGAKLKAIHCDIVPWSDYGGENFIFTPDEIELMARMEHDRWCGQKRKQGWVYGQVRDDRRKFTLHWCHMAIPVFLRWKKTKTVIL